MNRRDQFAMAAMQGMLGGKHAVTTPKDFAAAAIELADALIAELDRRTEEADAPAPEQPYGLPADPPEWAEWAAQHESVGWKMYQEKPTLSEARHVWYSVAGSRTRPVDNATPHPDWRNSLHRWDRERRLWVAVADDAKTAKAAEPQPGTDLSDAVMQAIKDACYGNTMRECHIAWEAARAAIAADRREREQYLLRQLQDLAVHIHANEYSENTQWQVSENIDTVILQIDNMVAGTVLVRGG